MKLKRVLGLATAALAVGAAVLVEASPAMAAPTFKVPFPCNQVWSGQTRTNHSPANAIDFNRTNDSGDPVVASAPGFNANISLTTRGSRQSVVIRGEGQFRSASISLRRS